MYTSFLISMFGDATFLTTDEKNGSVFWARYIICRPPLACFYQVARSGGSCTHTEHSAQAIQDLSVVPTVEKSFDLATVEGPGAPRAPRCLGGVEGELSSWVSDVSYGM